MKQEFEMLQQEMDDIIAINKNQAPVMKIGSVITGMDLREKINNYWQGLGDKYGFKHLTVEPSAKGSLFFLAEPKPRDMTYKQPYVELHNQDCLEGIKNIPDGSIDVILTDPPYLYLKNQKLERVFDEVALFTEWKRVLKKGGFIVLFGRGTSFYRWNTRLADMGFEFKEEIVWNKSMGTSPLSKLCRIHETIAILSNGPSSINKVKVPYLEAKEHNLSKIAVDINRIVSTLDNPQSIKFLKDFIDGSRSDMELNTRFTKHRVTSDIRKSGSREVNTLASIVNGITEKSIIHIIREHYNTIHPTQKPVRLLERLLALVSKEGDIVLDCFSGSGSTAAACINTQRKFIGFEIDEEYYKQSVERLKAHEPQLTMF